MTVRELLAKMDAREFAEWIAYARIEPFGEEVADHRAGTIASMIANVNRGPRTDAYDALAFIPWRERPKPADLSEKIKRVFHELGHGPR